MSSLPLNLKFLVMVHQDSSSASFSGCLNFFPKFLHISVSPTNVIPLAVSELRLPRKPMSFPLFLGVELSKSIALHLHMMKPLDKFAMIIINLLHFHIVFCKNLQLLMK